MKLDQLMQDKKNLYIIVGAVAVLLIVAVLVVGRKKSPGTATAQGPGMPGGMMGQGGAGMPGGGMPGGGMPGGGMPGGGMPGGGMPGGGMPGGGMPGGGMPGGGMPGGGMPGGAMPGGGMPGGGMPGAPGASGAPSGAAEAAPAAPAGEGDGTSIPKGKPVEQYRADPFQPTRRPRLAALPRMVLPPIVVVRDMPQAMVVPPTVNVIPTSVVAQGAEEIRAEIQRRMSGVLWNGRVYAIMETGGKAHHDIVRPGDQIGNNLWVRSISREEMVLIYDATGKREEVVVRLKESPQAAAMGASAGGMGGGMGGGGGMPGMGGGGMPGMGGGGMPGMGGGKGGMMMGPGAMGGGKGGMMPGMGGG